MKLSFIRLAAIAGVSALVLAGCAEPPATEPEPGQETTAVATDAPDETAEPTDETTDEPTGDDVATGAEPKWAIDLTVLQVDGRLYAVWSGWEENRDTDRTPQHLYIARMENPWTISSDRVLLSSPVESWERGPELDLNEGPQVLQRDGETFIIYSTRESWLPNYRLGQLRLHPGADPMDPASWEKSGPVFTRAPGVYGPGHNGFARSPDGTEDWLLYHAKADTTPGWNRVLRMQPFDWRDDGSPDFGSPVPSGHPVPVPSGQPCG